MEGPQDCALEVLEDLGFLLLGEGRHRAELLLQPPPVPEEEEQDQQKETKVDKRIITIIDKSEYNAGRVIGILERVLIYYFVLNAQFAAIGLVLAAKSFTRFKELEKREYAEYVLVGTLSSTLLAIMVASLAQSLFP